MFQGTKKKRQDGFIRHKMHLRRIMKIHALRYVNSKVVETQSVLAHTFTGLENVRNNKLLQNVLIKNISNETKYLLI